MAVYMRTTHKNSRKISVGDLVRFVRLKCGLLKLTVILGVTKFQRIIWSSMEIENIIR